MAGDDISPEQAHESHQRLVDYYFGNPAERPRIHIPARPTKDDDLVVSGYIDQSVARIAALESDLAQLRREKAEREELYRRRDEWLRAGAEIVDDETWINAGCPGPTMDLDALDAWLGRVIAMSDEYAKDLARKLSAELRQARARVRELEQAERVHFARGMREATELARKHFGQIGGDGLTSPAWGAFRTAIHEESSK